VPNVYILPDQRLVECGPGDAILSAALRAGVPFTHACGGHASCSTCRVVVMEGWAGCAERSPKERVIAERLGFQPEFRLACQMRITADVTIRRLVLDDRDTELADIRPRFRRKARGPLRWAFGSVVPRRPQVQPIGDEVRAAILFADIRGFTAFSEALLAYDVIHVLQRHVRQVTLAVERHGGVVTSYMGDGVMALFGPGHRQPASLRAVRAGLEMLAETEARRPALEELYGRSFDMNVGLHYGAVIIGTLWGSPPSVTAMGDTVNLASRIEQANKEHGTRFLMSDATLAELDDDVVIGRSFHCSLPGTAGEHTLIEVLDTALGSSNRVTTS
jgi:adenylate cyclase